MEVAALECAGCSLRETNSVCAIQTPVCARRQVLLGPGVTVKFILAATNTTLVYSCAFVDGRGTPPQFMSSGVWGTELEGRHEEANSCSGWLCQGREERVK